ncbi:MAG: AsmA family protein [Pseudaminobacter sp.]
MLARLFVFIGGLIVLALTAALVGPYFIDWTSYRGDFEREASAVLGRKVTVEGAATARLLPFPSVTFSDVSVGGANGRSPAMTVETFSMDAELAPFLRGEILIFDMRLVRPRAMIDIAADGTVDWAIRPSTPFDPHRIALEKLTVTDGEVAIRHAASGRRHLLSQINTEISAKSFAGPWRANGTALVDGERTTLAVSTGMADGNGAMRLRLRIDPDLYPLVIEADGNARIETGAARYSGQFKIMGEERQGQALRGGSGESVQIDALKPEPGFRLNGDFSLDHQRLGIEAFRFETGPLDNPYPADGTAFVELGTEPRFFIETKGAQVRFDEAVAGSESGAGLTLAERITALEKALGGLPKPSIPGNVEVNLPAIVAGDTTVRDVHLSAEPADGGWTVKSLAATLPGRTTLEADGFLRTGHEFGFAGSLLLAVGQPSGFAAWVASDVDEAIRRLPAAGFKATVDMTGQRQKFNDLELVLGDAKFRGRIDCRQPADMRPSVLLQLDGEALDVDGLAAFASLFVSDKGANRFADRDLDFEIKAGPVTAGGLTAETVDTALRLRNGLLEIDRLSIGGLAGASLSATGRIKDFPQSPTGNLDASILATDLAPLIALAAKRYPGNFLLNGLDARANAYPGLFEEARIDLVASAAAEDGGATGLALSVQGDAGGSAISAHLTGKGTLEALDQAPLSVSVSARNDDATQLLALAGAPALPLGLTGGGDLALSAKGTLRDGLETTFHLTAEDFRAHFDGTTGRDEKGGFARGSIGLDASDIEPWLMTMGVGLPGMGLGTPVSLTAAADYVEGVLTLDKLEGVVNEGAVSGHVSARLENGLPKLEGGLELDEIDLGPLISMVLGEEAVAPASERWSPVPFRQKSSAPGAADLKISAGTVAVGGLATAYDATMTLGLDEEGLRLSDVQAKLYGGALSGLFELKNNGGTGLFSSQMKLDGADLALAFAGTELHGRADFSTALTASGKSVGGLVSTLSGSGTAALKDLVIPGINPQAFGGFISEADAIGRDINAEQTAAFAPGIVVAGALPVADAEIAFTVAGGILRAPPVTFENPAVKVSANIRADLNEGVTALDGTIAYAPGEEVLAGSEPSLGFTLSGPPTATTRSLDTQPLAQFLTQRALEHEQARVEAMQAAVLEKQRLRREVRYYAALQQERVRAAEMQRLQQEEEDRRREAGQERARIAAEAARAKAEAQARAEEQARLEAEQAAQEREAARKREEAERLAAEERARRSSESPARPAPEIERTPLPPADDGSGAATQEPKPFNPFSVDEFLKSLHEGE